MVGFRLWWSDGPRCRVYVLASASGAAQLAIAADGARHNCCRALGYRPAALLNDRAVRRFVSPEKQLTAILLLLLLVFGVLNAVGIQPGEDRNTWLLYLFVLAWPI